MAEVAAAVPVTEVAAVSVAAGRGRGKAKGRGKLKGKAKAKGKMKKAPVEGAEPAPKKEPKLSLRAQVEQDVGDRNIEDVIKEARAKVEELQAAVQKAQEAEAAYESSILQGKAAMEAASATVDACVHKETIALEKFKAAKTSLINSQKSVAAKKLAVGEEEKALEVLSNEGENNKKDADLIKAQEEAVAAREAAKKALEEARAKEKEIAESIKAKRHALAITDDPEAEAKAKAAAEKAAEEAKAKQEAKHLEKAAEKDLKNSLKELEKARADRDKARAQAFKEAAGLGKAKKRLAVGDGSAASPAKAGRVAEKIQDVD